MVNLFRKRQIAVALVAVLAVCPGPAAADSPRTMRAVRVNPHAPVLDGQLNDPVWQSAEFSGGFLQKEPQAGAEPANRSEVAIVYDDDAIYIGARLTCENPDNVLATVSRRDNSGNSERIIISLDTYHDRRTAYTFAITASGTRIDYYHRDDTEYNRDYDFNPVWEGRVARTPEGWSAEMRVPFSQLRFRDEDEQVWGINMNRWVPTTNEDSYWIVIRKDEQGWSSRMGTLVGIAGIKPSRRLEVLPYAASGLTRRGEVNPDDPFAEENHVDTRGGGDFKMGVGPNLTLEGTINPDFGQVEADPAEVNLSAFETFFGERRPFFTEGSSLLAGGGSGYFYSRRIGSRPHGHPGGDFADVPNNTSILGAAKLTGRLNSGLSVGVLGALTQEEHADVYDASTGRTSRVGVEPRTGFGVLRLQQEFGKSQSTAGMILTGVGRDFSVGNDLDKMLPERAVTGGGDWNLRFRGGDYSFSGSAGFSMVEGTPEAITAEQTSSRRYYQRPDASHVELDTTRTSLSGWVTRGTIAKNAGRWLWDAGYGIESPGFELNDAGQLGSADVADGWVGGRYRQTDPGAHLHEWWAGAWIGGAWNNDGDRQFAYADYETQVTFKNFYTLFWAVHGYPASQSDDLTRGGPSMATPRDGKVTASLSSRYNRRFAWSVWNEYEADDIGGWAYLVQSSATYRSGGRWELTLSPHYYQIVNTRQYVDVLRGLGPAATYGDRFVFATLDRTDLAMQARLNYAFTPDLTLELYAEPFAASGSYSDFGHLLAARGNDLQVYGQDGGTITREEDGSYTIVDGADTFSIGNRDFNFISFRSNLVLRWEWSPGSTLFLVWQQNRARFSPVGDRIGPSDLWDSLSATGDNFFALKVTYWIPLL